MDTCCDRSRSLASGINREFFSKMATRKPLPGYNHNLRYKGRIYHVQTEDSGLENPHIFTHVFLEGMIIASARTDYKELVEQANHEATVRKMMQKQHKELMKSLRRGEYAEKIIQMIGTLEPEQPLEVEIPAAAAAAEAEPPAAAEVDLATGPPTIETPVPAIAEPAAPAEQPPPVPAEQPPPTIDAPTTPLEPPAEKLPAAAELRPAPDLPEFPKLPDVPVKVTKPAADTDLEITQFLDVRKFKKDVTPPPRDRPAPATDLDIETTQPIDVQALKKEQADELPLFPESEKSHEVPVSVAPQQKPAQDERLKTPSFYSHVYRDDRARKDSREFVVVRERKRSRPPVPLVGQQKRERQASRVFGKPLPGSPRLPAAEEAIPEFDLTKPRRSGVYLVPGGPPQRPPHPDPKVRRQSQPGGHRRASSPQRYTAPSRTQSQTAVPTKRKRRTGSYQEVPAHRTGERTPPPSPPVSQPPPVPAPEPIPVASEPPPRPIREPAKPHTQPEVVAMRPAVIISEPVHVGTGTRKRPPSRPMPLEREAPAVPLVERKAEQPSKAPPRTAEPSGVFGSDLISERSLDEVILAYLAEDSEGGEE
jgi:hypothetical protein